MILEEIEKEKYRIISALKNAQLILNDNNSFLYLEIERKEDMKNHQLGDGTFVASISLFALLAFFSKIYYVLIKGEEVIVTPNNIAEYERLKQVIKESTNDWKSIKKFYRKPRIGDINETEAFVRLIQNCPIDFGLDKESRNEITKVWHFFRNKLTHIISLGGDNLEGQMLVKTAFLGGDYKTSLDLMLKQKGSYQSFKITSEEVKDNFKKNKSIDNKTLQFILKDKCYSTRLNSQCQLLLNWLINEITSNKFSYENLKTLNDWLNSELEVN